MLYSVRNILRLCRKQILQNKRFNHGSVTNGANDSENQNKHEEFKSLFEKHKDKIAFNSHLEQEKLQTGYHRYYLKTIKDAKKAQKKEYEDKCLPPMPLYLQYYVDKDRLLKEDEGKIIIDEEKPFQLPLSSTNTAIDDTEVSDLEQHNDATSAETSDHKDIDKWMTNYEYFDDTRLSEESDDEDELDYEWSKQYGTPDPSSRVSQVPCGGCGALFHCSDPAIPGYLPSEIFKGRTDEELKTVECQRCHFLKEYNVALDVSVKPEEYEKLLQSIRNIKSLVVLMVDLLDFPCSIWPGIVDIIGTKRPIIIVGNKVDLLPGDSVGYLKRVREALVTEINKSRLREANVKYIGLISAKTGYGVENLISAMFKIWLSKGDVFLVGCTNVGKSSLFNALLQSDYCKVHAVDLVKRATVSRWPGTTLNLLKFPINRPSGWKIYERNLRLKADSRLMKVEKEVRKAHIEGTKYAEMPSLMGHIGRTFSDPREYKDLFEGKQRPLVLDEKDKMFRQSKWFYDTPGVIHPDQVLSMLTTEELLLTIPKQLIQPQTYYLHKGSTIFVAGLARLDFLDCTEPCRFTIFCSDALPITITKTEDADTVYKEFVGTELLSVPSGGEERMKHWPGLTAHEDDLELVGAGPKLCCGDVVLSSVAWVAVTSKNGSICRMRAWTPLARGIYVRTPSVLPYAINLKGKRLYDSPAYMRGRVFIDDHYIERHQLSKVSK